MNPRLTLLTISLVITIPISAQEIDTMVVTATRTHAPLERSLAAITVIDERDIQRLQAHSIGDLIGGLPGMSVANNGGIGKVTSVFVRGTESDHVLVLVDGIKVGSATLGSAAFEHLPLAHIERIEIVRGPRSSLYGSEAIGGVIQIFTRRGGQGLRTNLSLSAGQDTTYQAHFGVSGGSDRSWFRLSAASLDTDGYDACRGRPFPQGAGCFTDEPDRDGYNRISLAARGGYSASAKIDLEGHLLRSSAATEFDGGFVNQSDSVQEIVGGSVRWRASERWQSHLTFGRSRDQSDGFKNDALQNRFDTERDSLSWQNDIIIGPQRLFTLGLDYQNDQVDATTPFAVDARDNTGLFAQYQSNGSLHDLQLSVRHDDNQQFGSHSTGAIAWGLGLSTDLRLSASFGTAFKAPTFNELYFPGFGNTELRPEESQSAELGLQGQQRWGAWSLAAYHTRIDDLVAFDPATFSPANIARTQIRGLEASVDTQIWGWSVQTHLNWLKPQDRSSNNILPRRAEQSLRLDTFRPIGDYRIGISAYSAGRRYDDLANTQRLPGYATFDLRLDYPLNQAWLLQARVENLLDKDYETAAFFNQSGRRLSFTVRYQP